MDDTGADGGATTLVDTDGGNTGTVSLSATSETVEVVDAEGAGITRGKRLRIGGEVLLVYDIAGNQVTNPRTVSLTLSLSLRCSLYQSVCPESWSKCI